MKEIRKQYETEGLVQVPEKMQASLLPVRVYLTNDKKGCTVSIGVESIGLMFTVPFDEPLKDLEEAEKRQQDEE